MGVSDLAAQVPYNAAYQRGADMLMVTSTSWRGSIEQHNPETPTPLAQGIFLKPHKELCLNFRNIP